MPCFIWTGSMRSGPTGPFPGCCWLPHPSNRTDVIFSGTGRDTGDGVYYNVQYALCGKALKNGADLWIEETGRWFSDGKSKKSAGRPVRAHGILRVVNERRLVEERMDRLSRFDTLTGLLNRTMLNEAVDEQFKVMAHNGTEAGFLIVGFDHFDLINSVYGYAAGDEVITQIAALLRDNLRDVDTIARFSGTRLGILLPNCTEREMMVAGHRLLDLLGTTVVETSVGPIASSLSIGAVSIPRHARDMRGATVAAQQALTQSRRNRDSSLVSFRVDPVRAKRHMDSAKMAKRIVTALGDGHINLAWQPIVDAKTGETIFHEALLRLADSEGAPIAAKDFVGVAEELGLIRIVDHHALDLALATLAECPDAVFSLNVCHDTASDPLWLSKLAAAVNRDKTLPGRLIVEITESHAAESMEEALRFIHEVKGLGFRVALDDFGAGYTSFRNLKSLPFDIIKVDGQFVRNLASSNENQSFIRALVDLAGLFDAQVVVEWVEDEATARLLADWGVDLLQGFHYGAPEMTVPWSGAAGEMKTVESTRIAAPKRGRKAA